MKTFLLILITALFFWSCKDETSKTWPNPTISFVQDPGFVWNDTTIKAGDQIKIGVTAKTENDVNLTQLNYTMMDEFDTTSIDSGINVHELSFEKIITKNLSEFENWTITVYDKAGRSSSLTFNLYKDASAIWGDITHYSSIQFGAQTNATTGSFYSWENNQVYSMEDAFQNQEKINLLYYYDLIESDENTIASPGANIDNSVYPGDYGLANWTIKNITRFVLTNITTQKFITCTNDSLILATSFEFSSGKRKAKNLSPGDIYAFNNNSKKGLFQVLQVDGEETGTIEIEIKMQE